MIVAVPSSVASVRVGRDREDGTGDLPLLIPEVDFQQLRKLVARVFQSLGTAPKLPLLRDFHRDVENSFVLGVDLRFILETFRWRQVTT